MCKLWKDQKRESYAYKDYSVNPIYFVCFTTATIAASTILFQGFNVDSPVYVISLISGFIIIFTGVYLLDSIARGAGAQDEITLQEEDEQRLLNEPGFEDAVGLHDMHDDDSDLEEGLVNRRESGQRVR